MIGAQMFGQDSDIVPEGFALVGATLDTGRYPSSGLSPGDRVVMVYTDTNEGTQVGEAELFAVEHLVDSNAGDLFVTLVVPEGELVVAIANAAANNELSLARVAS